MVKSSNYVLVRSFDGFPKASDIKLVEEELPPLQDGEFLCEAEWISIDPYTRIFMAMYPLGSVLTSSQVARVTESRHPDYPVGTHVCGHFGWRTHTITNGAVTAPDAWIKLVYKIPYSQLPLSLALGVLGMTGVTAYEGFLGICEPKEGEVVVVSAAAGAVGSIVGQLAKLKGCTVIGYAGSDVKVNWLKKLGFDHAYNYKKVNLDTSLKEAAPNGVDCYFDSIQGEFLETVASNMKQFGRISIVGNIAEYNLAKGEKPKATIISNLILHKQLRVEGFHVHRCEDKFLETVEKLAKLVGENKIQYEETVHEGFKSIPNAFFEALDGQNLGKMVVKV
jgi:prostaglandin reductase 1